MYNSLAHTSVYYCLGNDYEADKMALDRPIAKIYYLVSLFRKKDQY